MLRAGFARSIITPPAGTPLAGFGARMEAARGVHDDLFARALVIEQAGARVAIVACDLCEIDAGFVEDVRRQVAEAVISDGGLMVAATHTHAGPATFPLYSAAPDPRWRAGLARIVAHTVIAAAHDLAPAGLAIGMGREATVARNRRRPDGPTDPTITVVRVNREGGPGVALAHYACHPTVLGPDNLLISRDYVGFTVDALERATGVRAAFLNGACGDVNAGHSADRSALGLPIPGRTFERAEALGARIAVEAIRAFHEAQSLPGGGRVAAAGMRLGAARRAVEVPLRPTPTADAARLEVEARAAIVRQLEESGVADADALGEARLELMYAGLAHGWVLARPNAVTERAHIQVIAVGDLAFVALPGEFFAESGLRLKGLSPFPHTIVVGYAGGGIGYVPPAAAFAEGGYETRLAHWSRLDPGAEPLIIEAARDLLETVRSQQDRMSER